LVELTPKDDAADTGGEVKSPIELAAEFIKQIIEDYNFKSLIFNLDDIKTRIDIDNKTPYQNVFMQEMEYMNALVEVIVYSLEEISQGI
jgi:dynein heavy chain, axonemal